MKNERTPGADRPSLEDVLDAYSEEGARRATLEAWIARFPEYEAELIEFTLTWLELERLPDTKEQQSAEVLELRGISVLGQVLHELRLRDDVVASPSQAGGSGNYDATDIANAAGPADSEASKIAEDSVHAGAGPPTNALAMKPVALEGGGAANTGSPPFESLKTVAEGRGLTLEMLAAVTKMSVTMIAALHRRLVVVSTLPHEVLETIGREVGRSTDAVRAYLALAPILPESANYKADRPPAIPKQIDFFELVRTDPELADNDRSYWLGLEMREL